MKSKQKWFKIIEKILSHIDNKSQNRAGSKALNIGVNGNIKELHFSISQFGLWLYISLFSYQRMVGFQCSHKMTIAHPKPVFSQLQSMKKNTNIILKISVRRCIVSFCICLGHEANSLVEWYISWLAHRSLALPLKQIKAAL